MSNKTNLGILPFQMVKIASDPVAVQMLLQQALLKNPGVALLGKDTIIVNGEALPLNQSSNKPKPTSTPTSLPTGGGAKPKKRGFLSTLLSSTSNAIKSHPVDTTLVTGSVATPVLYSLFGDDNNSSGFSEAPKAEPKAEPTVQPTAEPTVQPTAEVKPTETPAPTPAPTPSTTAPANGTVTPAGGTAGAENKDFIDRSIQSINEFKSKHPELFWGGVGLAGLGSVYALAKALDDDDDDDDYYYYRHR